MKPSGQSGTVDLRSDTVTKPTPAMRRAMAEAEVANDVYGEDPTVNRLQVRAAEIFEREASLFVPSGTMGNLIATKVWARPGTEVICEQRAHINTYELAGISAIAGCMPRTAAAADGILTWDLIEPLIGGKTYYVAQTGMICLENTNNMHGGTVYSAEATAQICSRARAAGLPVHLDGARIFNAALAANRSVAEMARGCDSIMFSLSKGLGAPVGSMLVGTHEFITKARAERKRLGGGMTQSGVLAAAGLVALEESPRNLHFDHENAKKLAQGVAGIRGIEISPEKVVTNIVIFSVGATGKSAVEVCCGLEERGVLAGALANDAVRMVTHCDVDSKGIDRAIMALEEVISTGAKN